MSGDPRARAPLGRPAPSAGRADPRERDAPGVVVRRLDPGESDLVRAVSDLVVAVYGGEGHVTGPYLQVLAGAADRAAAAHVLVALDAGAATPVAGLLGTVTLAIAPNAFANMTEPGEAEMRMLAVTPAARRRGIGRLLTAACLDTAAAAGATTIRLASNDTMTAAHALYTSLGFARTPGHDWSPEPGTTLMTFARPVGDPVATG